VTNEQETFAQRVAEAKIALRNAMRRVPPGLVDAGATRVVAYKQLMREAEKLLTREPMDPAPYNEARLAIEAVMNADLNSLVAGLKGWSDRTGLNRAPRQAA
jgi:hypothetical protein